VGAQENGGGGGGEGHGSQERKEREKAKQLKGVKKARYGRQEVRTLLVLKI